MAMADYYLCDVCGNKCFYDANLNWEVDDNTGEWSLDHMGDMAAICQGCAATHEIRVVRKDAPEDRHD